MFKNVFFKFYQIKNSKLLDLVFEYKDISLPSNKNSKTSAEYLFFVIKATRKTIQEEKSSTAQNH